MTALTVRLLVGVAMFFNRGFAVIGFAQFAQAPPPDLFFTDAMIERHAQRGIEQLTRFLAQQ